MKKRGSLKAQVSIEFLIIIGFAFMMTIPLVILFYQQSESINIEVTSSQVDKIASEIRDSADEVYYLGSPSKKTLTVYIPEGVNNITIRNNTIIFIVESASGDYEMVKWTAANLTGTLQNDKGDNEGIRCVAAQAYDDYVNLGYVSC